MNGLSGCSGCMKLLLRVGVGVGVGVGCGVRAGLDLSWLMEGAGAALGERGASRLSTSMLMAPVLSAQVAPNRVLLPGATVPMPVGTAVAVGCSNVTGAGCIPASVKLIKLATVGAGRRHTIRFKIHVICTLSMDTPSSVQ